jgi:hypothetical protein
MVCLINVFKKIFTAFSQLGRNFSQLNRRLHGLNLTEKRANALKAPLRGSSMTNLPGNILRRSGLYTLRTEVE